MQKLRVLVLGLGIVLIASFLATSCGDSKQGSSGGKDAGQNAGGALGTGGGPGLGGSGGADAGTLPLPACSGFSACGGSLVGTWKLPGKAICGSKGSGTSPASSCPLTTNLEELEQIGSTLTFSDGGTWISSIIFKGTEVLTYPASCLNGASCASLGDLPPDAGVAGSCIENTSGTCVCMSTLDMTETGQGTYTASGGKLSVSASDPSSMDYCVQGNVLSMHAVSSLSGDEATLVYERQ